MFEEILEFKNVTILYYGRQKYVALQQKVLQAQMCVIAKAVTFSFNLMVLTFLLNQPKGHWLLSNALIKLLYFL